MSIYTSIGTPTANSYVSVASANTYFNALEEADKWTQMGSTSTLTSTMRKENLLKQATRELDQTYRFYDEKYNQGLKNASDYQNLEFPRTSNTDTNGALYIPDEVKWATYEQAYWLMQRGGQRFDNDGVLVNPAFISSSAYQYLKGWIKRTIKAIGRYSWMGK